ncbi:MAG: GAF domain-containing protein, partial [Nitriliruptorales bacterium]|nr:GAF domain-containing protein [Nitriliruptorales bacterium]
MERDRLPGDDVPAAEATARAEREERLRRGLEASTAVITAGLEATDLDAAYQRVVREIREQLGWEAISLLLVEEEHIRVVAHYGYEQDVAAQRYSTKRGILGHVALTGEPYLAEDVRNDPFYDDVVSTTRSELCVPIIFAGRVRALLNAESPEPRRFTQLDRDILVRIADQLSLVMHNLDLLADREETVQRLHELDRLKSRLLTIASHELRTPLTVVMGFAEVLQVHAASLEPQRLQEYAEAIVRQSSELSQLVDQMLLASRIEQGQVAVHPKPVDLADVVVAAMGRHDERIEVLEGIEVARVRADPARLEQVLRNLFDNAVKYSEEGGRIQIDARRLGPDVEVLLRDEGPGIPGGEHERVFETFHQI